MERFSNGAILKWSNSQMEHFGLATLCHISRSQEQRNMACDVLLLGDFYRTQADDCLPFSLLLLGVDFDFEAGYNNCFGTHQLYTSARLVGWFALKLDLQ